MTHVELTEVANIINNVIDKTPHLKGNIFITPEDFSNSDGTDKAIFWADSIKTEGNHTTVKINEGDKFKSYFEKVTQSRKFDQGQFYHALKFPYALSTLQNKQIQLSALSYLWNNDPAEQIEFQKRHGFIVNFSEENTEKEKDRIFIFCFSDSFRNEAGWELYGDNETGVALGFRFKNFTEEPCLQELYQLKDIVYDGGYDFDFISEIQFRIFKRFKKRLFLAGLTTLSKFYKRKKYQWEQEIRLCFDYDLIDVAKDQFKHMGDNFPEKLDLEKYFPVCYDKSFDRHFIKINFDNVFFNLEITEIICGKNISDTQIELLKTITSPGTHIWRRK